MPKKDAQGVWQRPHSAICSPSLAQKLITYEDWRAMSYHANDAEDYDKLQSHYLQLLKWLNDINGGDEMYYPEKDVIWTYIMRHGLLGSGAVNADGSPNSFWSLVVRVYNIQPSYRAYWRTGSKNQIKHLRDGWSLAFKKYEMACLLRLAKQIEKADDPDSEWNFVVDWRYPDWGKAFSGFCLIAVGQKFFGSMSPLNKSSMNELIEFFPEIRDHKGQLQKEYNDFNWDEVGKPKRERGNDAAEQEPDQPAVTLHPSPSATPSADPRHRQGGGKAAGDPADFPLPRPPTTPWTPDGQKSGGKIEWKGKGGTSKSTGKSGPTTDSRKGKGAKDGKPSATPSADPRHRQGGGKAGGDSSAAPSQHAAKADGVGNTGLNSRWAPVHGTAEEIAYAFDMSDTPETMLTNLMKLNAESVQTIRKMDFCSPNHIAQVDAGTREKVFFTKSEALRLSKEGWYTFVPPTCARLGQATTALVIDVDNVASFPVGGSSPKGIRPEWLVALTLLEQTLIKHFQGAKGAVVSIFVTSMTTLDYGRACRWLDTLRGTFRQNPRGLWIDAIIGVANANIRQVPILVSTLIKKRFSSVERVVAISGMEATYVHFRSSKTFSDHFSKEQFMYVAVAPEPYLVNLRSRIGQNVEARASLESTEPDHAKRLRLADLSNDWRMMFNEITKWITNNVVPELPVLNVANFNSVIPDLIRSCDKAANPDGAGLPRADPRQSQGASASPAPAGAAAESGTKDKAEGEAPPTKESDLRLDPSVLAAAGAAAATDQVKRVIESQTDLITQMQSKHQETVDRMTTLLDEYERRNKLEAEAHEKRLKEQQEEYQRQIEQLQQAALKIESGQKRDVEGTVVNRAEEGNNDAEMADAEEPGEVPNQYAAAYERSKLLEQWRTNAQQLQHLVDYEDLRRQIKDMFSPDDEEGNEARTENVLQEMELLQSIAVARAEAMYQLIFLATQKLETNYPRRNVGDPPPSAPIAWAATVEEIQELIEAVIDEDDKARAKEFDLQAEQGGDDQDEVRSVGRSSGGLSSLSRDPDRGWQRSASKVRSLRSGPLKDHHKKLKQAGIVEEDYCLSYQELCDKSTGFKKIFREIRYACQYCSYFAQRMNINDPYTPAPGEKDTLGKSIEDHYVQVHLEEAKVRAAEAQNKKMLDEVTKAETDLSKAQALQNELPDVAPEEPEARAEYEKFVVELRETVLNKAAAADKAREYQDANHATPETMSVPFDANRDGALTHDRQERRHQFFCEVSKLIPEYEMARRKSNELLLDIKMLRCGGRTCQCGNCVALKEKEKEGTIDPKTRKPFVFTPTPTSQSCMTCGVPQCSGKTHKPYYVGELGAIHHHGNCVDLDAASRNKSGMVCEECYNVLGGENGCGLFCWWLRQHSVAALEALQPNALTLHCAFITAMMVHHDIVVNMGGIPLMCGIVKNVGIFRTDDLPDDYPPEHYLRTMRTVPIPRNIQNALNTDPCLKTARVRSQVIPTYNLLYFDTKLEEIRNASRMLLSTSDSYVVLDDERSRPPAYQPLSSVWEEVATEPSNSASPTPEEEP